MRNRPSSIITPVMVGLCLFAVVISRAGDDRPDRRKTMSANDVARLSVKDVGILEFRAPENLGGEIQVRTDVDVLEALIEVNENVSNVSDEDQAKRILESITVESSITNDVLHVEVKTPESAEWEGTDVGVHVDLAILIPPGLIFKGDSEHYNFDLAGPLPEVEIIGRYGKIRVEDVTEHTDLRSEYGSLTLISAQGKVEIRTRYGTATLEDITVGEEPLRIRGERGSISLERIEGPVNISADDCQISITDWTLRTGESRVATQNSPIEISFADWGDPEVIIENRRAKVEIGVQEGFSSSIRLGLREEGRGFIRTRGLPIKATRLNQKTLEGIAGDGGGMLQVSNIDGDITLYQRGDSPAGGGSL